MLHNLYDMFNIIPKLVAVSFTIYYVQNIDSKETEEGSNFKQEQVVVRAVFINCEPNEDADVIESEATRFQREELFKHSALQDCLKKLALTVKIASEPEKSSGDEYIPIEHVFDGSNKKRTRLLNPYILRLRRETPLQAYKLRRVDTVNGILTESDGLKRMRSKKNRVLRNLDELTNQVKSRLGVQRQKDHYVIPYTLLTNNTGTRSEQKGLKCDTTNSTSRTTKARSSNVNVQRDDPHKSDSFIEYKLDTGIYEPANDDIRVKRDTCTLTNNPLQKREKRQEHNIIVEDITDEYIMPRAAKKRFPHRFEHAVESRGVTEPQITSNYDYDKTDEMENQFKPQVKNIIKPQNLHDQIEVHRTTLQEGTLKETKALNENGMKDMTHISTKTQNLADHSTRKSFTRKPKNPAKLNSNERSPERNFVIYDIGNADLWYTVNVQLFEKTSTSEGKTIWNDITKGEVASVSTLQPEWTDPDIIVRYKPSEWIAKEEFTLPSANNLCVLVPVHDDMHIASDDYIDIGNFVKYIIVPKDDIVGLDDKNILNKRNDNYTYSSLSGRGEKDHRRVMVRVSRAMLTEREEELQINAVGPERFLTMPHRRTHRAQIDLEARADYNQLIRVGSSGSIITIVADNTRRTRSIITVQATNKGLAAANFRVRTRDCGPEMASVMNEKSEGIVAGPILLPPRHTQRFRFEIPAEIPVEKIHCSVALINDEEESVAVRDVAIKKNDRCFCVWHCDCVCLNEDPKLSCSEMAPVRQASAGLRPRAVVRRARSVCYSDCVSVNLCVIAVGVLLALLILGIVKACFGLFCGCVRRWGLDKVVDMPRKLERYYEPGLQDRTVVYDSEGWPIHPDTKKRSVRVISASMEFLLNIIIFIVLPCLMLRNAVNQLVCQTKRRRPADGPPTGNDKKCFSTHDMQGQQLRWRRKRGGMYRWMTPEAEELSTDIWSNELVARKPIECDFMRPLLHERDGAVPSSCANSEQDDAEYILMQMQKSKESLVRSKKNPDSGPASDKNALNTDAKMSHSKLR